MSVNQGLALARLENQEAPTNKPTVTEDLATGTRTFSLDKVVVTVERDATAMSGVRVTFPEPGGINDLAALVRVLNHPSLRDLTAWYTAPTYGGTAATLLRLVHEHGEIKRCDFQRDVRYWLDSLTAAGLLKQERGKSPGRPLMVSLAVPWESIEPRLAK